MYRTWRQAVLPEIMRGAVQLAGFDSTGLPQELRPICERMAEIIIEHLPSLCSRLAPQSVGDVLAHKDVPARRKKGRPAKQTKDPKKRDGGKSLKYSTFKHKWKDSYPWLMLVPVVDVCSTDGRDECPGCTNCCVMSCSVCLRKTLKHYAELKVGHTAPLSPSEFPSIRTHWSLLKTDLFEVRNKLTANGTRPVKKGDETAATTQFYKKVFQDNVADSAADNDRTPLCRGLRYLVCAMLVLELSSVCCERGFSCMNHVKCKARNRVYVEMLDCLMMIELNGPAIQEKRLCTV